MNTCLKFFCFVATGRNFIFTVLSKPKIMIWSAIRSRGNEHPSTVRDGKTELIQRNPKNCLLPSIKVWFYMGKHARWSRLPARIITTYLQKEFVSLFDWAGNIPDMNPVENVWEQLKRWYHQKIWLLSKIIQVWNHHSQIQYRNELRLL